MARDLKQGLSNLEFEQIKMERVSERQAIYNNNYASYAQKYGEQLYTIPHHYAKYFGKNQLGDAYMVLRIGEIKKSVKVGTPTILAKPFIDLAASVLRFYDLKERDEEMSRDRASEMMEKTLAAEEINKK